MKITTIMLVAVIFISIADAASWQLYSTVDPGGGANLPNTLMALNPQTGEQTQIGPQGDTPAEFALDFDTVSGFLYGVAYTDYHIINKINISTGQSSVAATLQESIQALAFSPDGTLYGISERNILGTINLGASTFSQIATLDIPGMAAGIDFSPQGELYLVDMSGYNMWLRVVNETSGEIINSIPITGNWAVGDIDFAPDGYIYHTNYSWWLMKIDTLTGIQAGVGSGELGPLGGIVSLQNGCSGGNEASINLNGEYWFGSLKANTLPFSKQGTVTISGNHWVQQWEDNYGSHSFIKNFTTSKVSDGSYNINFPTGTYNIAWNGNMMVHTDNTADSFGYMGIDIMIRKAENANMTSVVGEYGVFGHSLDYVGDWDISWDEDAWGTFVLRTDHQLCGTSTDSKGDTGGGCMNWDMNSVTTMIRMYSPDSVNYAMPCKGGLVLAATTEHDDGGGMSYELFVRETTNPITFAEMAGTYQVRFLETGPGTGDVYTCSQGRCVIGNDGSMSIDAYYSDGEHDVFTTAYTFFPGQAVDLNGDGIPDETASNLISLDDDDVSDGIISPDKNLILIPEYKCSDPRTNDDWIGGILLIREIPEAEADLNGDSNVDFGDLAVFVEQWLCEEVNSDFYQTDLQHIVNFLDFNVLANNWPDSTGKLADFAGDWLKRDAYNADIAGGDSFVDFLDFAAFAENWMK
ncbi:MAG: hypothetical protein LLF92_02020 [Planctomycetaceae bacterium]|nr:hypothetical protein [Planctomycetaceae bacterium]